MIFVDASAMLAMLTDETDGRALAVRMAEDGLRTTSPIAIYEATLAITRKRQWSVQESRDLLGAFLTTAKIEIMDVTAAHADIALDAFEWFGKGRHPARLTMGVCSTYACAMTSNAALPFKGDEFAKTDIEAA